MKKQYRYVMQRRRHKTTHEVTFLIGLRDWHVRETGGIEIPGTYTAIQPRRELEQLGIQGTEVPMTEKEQWFLKTQDPVWAAFFDKNAAVTVRFQRGDNICYIPPRTAYQPVNFIAVRGIPYEGASETLWWERFLLPGDLSSLDVTVSESSDVPRDQSELKVMLKERPQRVMPRTSRCGIDDMGWQPHDGWKN